MAQSIISEGLAKANEALNSTADAKQKQIDSSPLTKVADDKQRITTDFGVKQSNTDDWLKVVTENQTGPMLLEDSAGREKVRTLLCGAKPVTLTSKLDPPF